MSPLDTPKGRIRAAGGRTKTPHKDHGEADPTAQAEESWPEPVDFLADGDLTGVPEFREDHLPAAIFPFVKDTADRMGVDPTSVALSALVALSSVADDKRQLQPKQRDETWTEAPRFWGAIVGYPSVLKTPAIRTCTGPVDCLDIDARRRHAEEMLRYDGDLNAWKDAGSDPGAKPAFPKLDRYVVESATTEALSEVLRTDADAKQRAPTGKF